MRGLPLSIWYDGASIHFPLWMWTWEGIQTPCTDMSFLGCHHPSLFMCHFSTKLHYNSVKSFEPHIPKVWVWTATQRQAISHQKVSFCPNQWTAVSPPPHLASVGKRHSSHYKSPPFKSQLFSSVSTSLGNLIWLSVFLIQNCLFSLTVSVFLVSSQPCWNHVWTS